MENKGDILMKAETTGEIGIFMVGLAVELEAGAEVSECALASKLTFTVCNELTTFLSCISELLNSFSASSIAVCCPAHSALFFFSLFSEIISPYILNWKCLKYW